MKLLETVSWMIIWNNWQNCLWTQYELPMRLCNVGWLKSFLTIRNCSIKMLPCLFFFYNLFVLCKNLLFNKPTIYYYLSTWQFSLFFFFYISGKGRKNTNFQMFSDKKINFFWKKCHFQPSKNQRCPAGEYSWINQCETA